MKRLLANQESLRRMIETGIPVGSISEVLFSVDEGKIGSSLMDELTRKGFDRCGVTRDGEPIGYVEPGSSDEPNWQLKGIALTRLVAESASLWSTLKRLATSGWLFVLPASGEMGIVTVADLSKQPARLLMFGVISLLEMTMLEIVRRECEDDELSRYLKAPRLADAKSVWEDRRKHGQEIDLRDCLQLCDKKTICSKIEHVRNASGFTSKTRCAGVFKAIEALRNQLAHAQHPSPDGNWSKVVESLREADRLIVAGVDLLEQQAEDA